MRTSLNNLKHAENFIEETMPKPEALVFEAKMIVSKQLRDDVRWQKKIYSIVQSFGRRILRKEISLVHDEIFNPEPKHPLKERIHKLFN